MVHIILILSIISLSLDQVSSLGCTAEWCNPNHQPRPNIFSVMTGYNILKGNPFAAGTSHDPGFTKFIFIPTKKDVDNRYKLVGGITASDVKRCNLLMNTEVVSTMEELTKTTGNQITTGTSYASNYETEVSGTIKGVGVKTTIPPMVEASFSSSKEFIENEKFFTGTEGILTMNDATCSTYSIKISDYKPPDLTEDFVAAVKELESVSDSSDFVKKSEFDKFVNNFGTHFIKTAIMGGRMAITRRYTRDEFQQSTDSAIKKCNTARLALSFGQSVTTTREKCSQVAKSATSTTIGSFDREYVTSYGSTPMADVYEWAKQDFNTPLPIKMTLSPILNLFTKAHMDRLGVDYIKILKWIAPYYDKYCETHKDALNIKSCKPKEEKGCGWNDNCNPRTTFCINKSSLPNGYYCCTPKCENNPCRHGGTCADVKSTCGYKCSCKAPWFGTTCTEKSIKSDVLDKEILSQMSKYKWKSHNDFRYTLRDYLNSVYPLYTFSVNIYNPVSGYDNHAFQGYCSYHFRKEGRNVVVCYTRKSRGQPSSSSMSSAVQKALSAVKDKGCDAKWSRDTARKALLATGQPISMVLVVRHGNGLRSTWTGSNTRFENYRCRHECKTSWGRRKCTDHMSSLVMMFGRP